MVKVTAFTKAPPSDHPSNLAFLAFLAFGGDGVWRCVQGCLARHTAMVAVSAGLVIRLSSHSDPRLYKHLHKQLYTLSYSLQSLLVSGYLILISRDLPHMHRDGRSREIKMRLPLTRRL